MSSVFLVMYNKWAETGHFLQTKIFFITMLKKEFILFDSQE